MLSRPAHLPWLTAAGVIKTSASILRAAVSADGRSVGERRTLGIDVTGEVTLHAAVARPAVETLHLHEAVDEHALDVTAAVVARRARLVHRWRCGGGCRRRREV